MKFRSFTGLALYPNNTIMVINNAMDRCQPKTGSFARLFGCKIGIKKLFQGLAAHPLTGIANRYFNIPATNKLFYLIAAALFYNRFRQYQFQNSRQPPSCFIAYAAFEHKFINTG